MTEIEKRLAKLAVEISREHQALRRAFKATFRSALRAGDLLNEAKAQAGHGNYTAWVEENCEFSDRTARVYTRLANNRDKVEEMLKTADSADLSISEVLRELSAPKEYVLTNSIPLTPRERVEGPRQRTVAGATVLTRPPRVEQPFRWPNAAPTPSPQVQPFASWSDEEHELLDAFRAGESIVVNMRDPGPHKNLVSWLVDTNQLTRADRKTEWGNPFVEGEDGDRETVVRLYEEHYLPYKRRLQDKLSKMEGPTAWGCWCAPQPCHCDVLKRVAAGGSSAEAKVAG